MAELHKPGDRRPIASRDWRMSASITTWLVRAGATPNSISVVGMISGIAAGVALALTSWEAPYTRVAWLAGAGFIQLRLLANMFDGMVAIESGRVSAVGEIYNELPDRISDAATLIGAGYASGGHPVLGYLAACMALILAYVRALGKVAGAHQEFCGPMAKQHRMATVTLAALYCSLAPRDWQTVSNLAMADLALLVIIGGGVWTFVKRLSRITAALRSGANK